MNENAEGDCYLLTAKALRDQQIDISALETIGEDSSAQNDIYLMDGDILIFSQRGRTTDCFYGRYWRNACDSYAATFLLSAPIFKKLILGI